MKGKVSFTESQITKIVESVRKLMKEARPDGSTYPVLHPVHGQEKKEEPTDEGTTYLCQIENADEKLAVYVPAEKHQEFAKMIKPLPIRITDKAKGKAEFNYAWKPSMTDSSTLSLESFAMFLYTLWKYGGLRGKNNGAETESSPNDSSPDGPTKIDEAKLNKVITECIKRRLKK